MRKYSIVVPIYKVEKYIRECIDSIIRQTYKNIEIILVDDGSPDTCPDICNAYAVVDDRIIVVHKENGGLVSARKAGAQIATGDYVFCVDGDDYISEDYIEKFNRIIELYEYDIICCGYYQAAKDGLHKNLLPQREGAYDSADIENEIFPSLIRSDKDEVFLPTVWGKAFKRELYLKYQMIVCDDITMGEDGAVTIPLISNINSMYVIHDALYYYRYNESSMTKVKKPLSWDNHINVINHIIRNIDLSRSNFQEQMDRRIARSFLVVSSSQLYSDKSLKDIKHEIDYYRNIPLFEKAIRSFNYKHGVRGMIISLLIKNKNIYLLQLFNKLS